MVSLTSKYALINGHEAKLVNEVPHATSGGSVCVFKYCEDDTNYYVFKAEWDIGATRFVEYAQERCIVTSASSTNEKIALFRSLFRGREDVYAHGYRTKQGGIGYSPVCTNERTQNCPRWTRNNPGIKCAECSKRKFFPPDNQAYIRHFRGERDDFTDVLGLYVLQPDCKTWVLVADFDKDGWQRETQAYCNACKHFGLFPAAERSRSGNGAHVWLFFEEPIEAGLARDLGSALITYAMDQSGGVSFESYDRLFPTQATIPEGGFGNLIALPFQGKAQKVGNSVFVDDGFVEFPDQWRFLSSITKVSRQKIQEILDSLTEAPLGVLELSDSKLRKAGELFSDSIIGSLTCADRLTANDFPRTLHIVKSNMLIIEKRGLSVKAQNRLRRLAAFGNPEFYRAQAMHQSVYGKPRIIWCGEEADEYIMLPRGCDEKLIDLAKEFGSVCVIEDKRNTLVPIAAEFNGTLRERQQQAADALLGYECGILSAPTGFGKTVIGAYLIGKLKVRTLVIVPKANLIDQWKTRLAQFLDIEDDRPTPLTKSGKPSKKKRFTIGQIGGGKNKPSSLVDIATFQSLTVKNDLGIVCAKEIIANYDLIICDECHYAAAPNLELAMKSVHAQYVYGLSATPKRSDGLDGVIFMHLGPIRHKVDPKEQAIEQGIRRILIPRFTRVRLTSLEPGVTYNQVIDKLCEHAARNAFIVQDVIDSMEAKRTPLIITKRKEHATTLANLLKQDGVNVFVLTGEGSDREKRERLEQVRKAEASTFAIVATGSYIGEGFDLPSLDTLMLTSPYSWEGVITQYSGRLHRENKGKREVMVYDYVDANIPMLERMYKKRLKAYAKLGYEIGDTASVQEPTALMVAANNWLERFRKDICQSSKSIVVSAPYANPATIQALTPDIQNAIARGVECRVVLKRPKSHASISFQNSVIEELTTLGCSVRSADSPMTGIAIFDERICWYGALPLLAFAKGDDCSLRVDNIEISLDLKQDLELI